jgi:hypothetical protein
MFRLALKGSFHGSYWSVGEGKESMHIIITIGASDQIVTYLKDVVGLILTSLRNLSNVDKIIHPLGCSWFGSDL